MHVWLASTSTSSTCNDLGCQISPNFSRWKIGICSFLQWSWIFQEMHKFLVGPNFGCTVMIDWLCFFAWRPRIPHLPYVLRWSPHFVAMTIGCYILFHDMVYPLCIFSSKFSRSDSRIGWMRVSFSNTFVKSLEILQGNVHTNGFFLRFVLESGGEHNEYSHSSLFS